MSFNFLATRSTWRSVGQIKSEAFIVSQIPKSTTPLLPRTVHLKIFLVANEGLLGYVIKLIFLNK